MASNKEMPFFIVILLTGYHSLPEYHHYWSTQHDLGVPAVYNTISRKRYHEIKRYLNFAGNQRLTEGDKMSKISFLYNILNFNLFKFDIFYELLSVDKSMVPYFRCTVPKCLSEGSQFVLFTKFGACVKVMVIRIPYRYIRESSQTQSTSL